MRFATIRLIVITLSLLAQAYLFVRIRQAIRSSSLNAVRKPQAIAVAGTAIFLLFLGNAYIMARPIPWTDPPTLAQIVLFYPPALWVLGANFSALFLFTARIAGWFGRQLVWIVRRLAGKVAPPAVHFSRRRFLQSGAAALAAAPVLLAGYGSAVARQHGEVQSLDLPFGRPLRVVQLSDIHAGLYMNRKQMRRYAEQVMDLRPDLFVITGDFISNSLAFLPGCLEEMARVRARYGTFTVLGNHEHWYGGVGELRTIFQKSGIALLHNTHRVIRHEEGEFAVAGIDDLLAGRPDLAGALHGLEPGLPTLLLSHRPEIFPQAAARGISLTLAGHYHGGQLKLVLPEGDLSLAHIRTPYPEGLYRLEAAHLYVNRGLGTTFTPVRLNVPPEITLFNLA